MALNAAFGAALDTGRVGREGLMTGILFSILAAAALARLGANAAGLQSGLTFAPGFAWAAAGAIAMGLMMRERRRA